MIKIFLLCIFFRIFVTKNRWRAPFSKNDLWKKWSFFFYWWKIFSKNSHFFPEIKRKKTNSPNYHCTGRERKSKKLVVKIWGNYHLLFLVFICYIFPLIKITIIHKRRFPFSILLHLIHQSCTIFNLIFHSSQTLNLTEAERAISREAKSKIFGENEKFCISQFGGNFACLWDSILKHQTVFCVVDWGLVNWGSISTQSDNQSEVFFKKKSLLFREKNLYFSVKKICNSINPFEVFWIQFHHQNHIQLWSFSFYFLFLLFLLLFVLLLLLFVLLFHLIQSFHSLLVLQV